MKKPIIIIFLGLFLLSAPNIGATSLQFTIPEFVGPTNYSGFPKPAITVGGFSYAIPQGEQIISATLSGTFGNSLVPSSAGVDLFLDNLFVGQCKFAQPCWFNSTSLIPWNYTFSVAEFSLLADGKATLTAVQTALISIELGKTTLQIETEPIPLPPPPSPADGLPTPEPGTLVLLGTGIGVLTLTRRIT